MNKYFYGAAALVAVAATPAADAAVIFTVQGSFNTGGTLTGTFTTNDAITDILAINLNSTANGSFQATSYTSIGAIDAEQLPNFFRITVNGPPGKQLQLVFSPALTLAGSAIGGNSFEAQQIQGAGNRTISGTVRVAAVPEPAAWAMMIGGFGLVGAAMRRRRTTLSVSFA